MEWISEQLNKRNRLTTDLGRLDRGIQDVWRDLCAALTETVNYYKAAVSERELLQMNGEPYATWILRNGDEPVLTIRFERTERRIAIDGLNGKGQMGFALDSRDSIWLIGENGKQGIEQAARSILEPILFPDLQNPPRVRV